MKVTYYGHSCFMVEVSGKKLLFDPFISPNELAKEIDIKTVRPDYLLISHGHEDHVADVLEVYKNSEPTVISAFEIVRYYSEKTIKKVKGLNIGGSVNFDFGRVKYVVAMHSSVLPDGTYAGNPGGFVVEAAEGSFYFAGDTGLTYDMKLIAEEFDLNFAFLPLGDSYTMGVKDAIRCSDFINCNRIIGMHYDTFEQIEIDHQEAVDNFRHKGKELVLMRIGESRDF
ncbi:MAG: metal-dependent hydrolase [Bacteroidia bacterium]